MRWFAFIVFVLLAQLNIALAAANDSDKVGSAFVVLSYHEAREEVRNYPDPYAVDTAVLVRQFAWLRGNGYSPVSLDEIIVARNGGKHLPDKAVLLTFDDAYLSFYTHVYPLLREFRFPAVLAVVGHWIDNPHGVAVMYGEKGSVPYATFPSWIQLREMADSGLIEIASHTYDLHQGVPANPQGNLQPAATARVYAASSASYENDSSWRERVRNDLVRNLDVIEGNTGYRPRAVVWPYGSYNDELISLAGEMGLGIALTLDDGVNTPDVPLNVIRRTLIEHNPTLAEFAVEVRGPRNPEPMRVVQVDLDDIYNVNPVFQERNLSVLLDRIGLLKPTHVFLRATSDSDEDGVADVAYFPNQHLPLRSDLFNRVAWQIASRVDAKVFAVMPISMYRLSQESIAEVYEDLARYANFEGVVFDDKNTAGLEFTRLLAKRARAFRAPMKTVRTLAVEPLRLITSGWLEHSKAFEAFCANYNHVALLVEASSRQSTLSDVFPAILGDWPERSLKHSVSQRKLIVMLHDDSPPASRLIDNWIANQMRRLQLGGVLNFGYGPDDALHDNPPISQIAPVMSLRVYPQKQKVKE